MDSENGVRRSPRRIRHSIAGTGQSKENDRRSITLSGGVTTASPSAKRQLVSSKQSSRMSLPASASNPTVSRRILAPRKSALKTTQQKFLSPTGLVASPVSRPIRQHTMMILGSSQMSNIDDVFADLAQEQELEDQPKTAPIAVTPAVMEDEEGEAMGMEGGRKRRRVTFSRRQEKTDFISDEPTMSIRPASEYGPAAPEPSKSSAAPRSQKDDEDGSESDSDSDSDSDVEEYRQAKARASMGETSDMDLITGSSFTAWNHGGVEADDVSYNGTMTMEFTKALGAQPRSSIGGETVDMELDESSQEAELSLERDAAPSAAEESYQTQSSSSEEDRRAGQDGEASMEFTVPFSAAQAAGLSRISEEDSEMIQDSTRMSVSMDFTRPFTSEAPPADDAASSGTPSKVRSSMPYGYASPSYKHSPARRVQGAEAPSSGAGSSPKRSPRKEFVVPPELRQRLSAIPPHMVMEKQNPTSGDSSMQSTASDLSVPGQLTTEVTLPSFLDAMGLKFQDQLSAVKPHVARPDDPDEQHFGPNVVRWAKAAAGGSVLLENLMGSCQALEDHVEQSRQDLEAAEAEFNGNPPGYACDVMSYPPEKERERKAIEAQFKLQKQAARAHSVAQYYGWRLDNEFDDEVAAKLETNRSRLQEDASKLDAKLLKLGHQLLPDLQKRHAELKAHLKAEKEHQAAVAASDQNELTAIHAAIEDQIEVLETFRTENREALDNLERAQERINETTERKRAAEAGIEAARAACEQIRGFTRGEASRIQREIRSVEDAHLWSLTKASSTEMTLVHNNRIDVNFKLAQSGLIQTCTIKNRRSALDKDGMCAFVTSALQETLRGAAKKPTDAIRLISAAFCAQRHLRAECDALSSFFPIELIQDKEGAVTIQATVLLSARRAKLQVLAPCKKEALLSASAQLFRPEDVQVELTYGAVDAPAIQAQIADMLGAAPSLRSLANACVESLKLFNA